MSEAARPRRLCIINTHPIQYYAPLYRYLAENDTEIELEVFYLSDLSLRGEYDSGFRRSVTWDIDLLSGYTSRFVGPNYKKATPGAFSSLVVPELLPAIIKGRFDAVAIYGYSHAASIVAAVAARVSGADLFFRCDMNVLVAKRRRQDLAKRLFVRSVFAACSKMLVIGSRNREYYRWMGVPDRKFVFAPFTVDNDRFFAASRLTHEERSTVRAGLGIVGSKTALLFISKFMPGKRPDLLIKAAAALAADGYPLHLVMAGSGEMEEELRALAGCYPSLSVSFPGFVNQSEMPKVLGACDVMVFPSEIDQWGLIVNEAMAVGLPVIVGAESGCAPDLVENGVNGFLVPPGDLDALTAALEQIVADDALRARMGEASLKRMQTWSFRETHAGLRQALGLRSVSGDGTMRTPASLAGVAST
ncbi:glycosyltransferase family 4 protein [Aquibium microcysteis]|uniref:glycosyltransferase family 4 protein n=1 Tax=Aquibium microcysteis TaxID=675281 RepID=UPI00165D075A|nr:glycosyltransferase family 4 protein [Aquibium microcysteis]